MAKPRTLKDYDRCTRDGKGRTQEHPDFDPTVEGSRWSKDKSLAVRHRATRQKAGV